MTKDNVIGAVLAGGYGRRIGCDKATVELDGRPLISYPVGALRSAGLDVVLALRSGQEMLAGLDDVSFVHDEFEGAGPLGGLHALLKWMPGEWALVVSCDQPFVRVNLLHGIMSHSDCTADAVVARMSECLQPMPGLFRKTCLPFVEEALAKGEMGLRNLLHHIRLYELEGEEIDRLDFERSSFININTPEDLANARRLAVAL
ncbi:MAG: molybdenum cofactor guanylyltransferase [Chloroflexi bacterium]|nr:molybdenum cofactor guanylyltransferase [Chloroflexota bacterium]